MFDNGKGPMTESDSNHSVAEKGTAITGSLLAPVPIGKTAKTKVERGDAYSAPEIYDVEITVVECLRGEPANRFMAEQKMDELSAQVGYEFLPVRISFGYHRRGRGFGNTPFFLSAGQFAAASGDGKTTYPMPAVSRQPVPGLFGEQLSPGHRREGWMIVQVPSDECRPLLFFNREYSEGVYGVWGGVWFQLLPGPIP